MPIDRIETFHMVLERGLIWLLKSLVVLLLAELSCAPPLRRLMLGLLLYVAESFLRSRFPMASESMFEKHLRTENSSIH